MPDDLWRIHAEALVDAVVAYDDEMGDLANHQADELRDALRVAAERLRAVENATPDRAGRVPAHDRSVALGKSFVDAASESQKVTRQTEAVLKSMPADEDVPVPPWPLRWGEPMNGYTACVAIDCPPDVVLKQVHR